MNRRYLLHISLTPYNYIHLQIELSLPWKYWIEFVKNVIYFIVSLEGNTEGDTNAKPDRGIIIHGTGQESVSMSTTAESPTEHSGRELPVSGQTAPLDEHDSHHQQQQEQWKQQRPQRHHADDEDHEAITVVRVERPVFTRDDFIAKYNKPTHRAGSIASSGGAESSHHGELLPKMVMRHIHQRLKGRRLLATPSGGCLKRGFMSLFPFLRIMKEYNVKTDLLNDIMAGLIVGVMNIPQGMPRLRFLQ